MSRAQRITRMFEFSDPSEERVTLRFGNQDSRHAVLSLLKAIETCSMAGAGRIIKQYVDGDGAYSFRVKGDALKPYEKPDLEDDEIQIRGVD